MFALKKFVKKGSSRHQIAIEGVEDGILSLPNREYRVIIETSSINFHLMSQAEQDVTIDIYRAFLNSLSFPIQILERVRQLDIDDYDKIFEQKQATEQVLIYKSQIANYRQYVKSLVKTNKILSRRFYLIIPYTANGKETMEVVREQLVNRLTIVERGLGNVGIKCRALSSLQILDLFYASYNPKEAKLQPITERTLALLNQNYF
ncbi:MAG TPA: hypothetical protein VD907_06415 [Verrucomicrobiae bacterium]|nr:hypothetical protein [Verrucomicrobiae bacterium]